MSENEKASNGRRLSSHLIRLPEAAAITGLPLSLLRKTFMSEEKRPTNIPAPPPHKRIGRAIYILADRLEDWVKGLAEPKRRRKPTSRRAQDPES